jgi:hypothetical protein
MTSETPRSIPKLDIKLKGQENFAEWKLSVEIFLQCIRSQSGILYRILSTEPTHIQKKKPQSRKRRQKAP